MECFSLPPEIWLHIHRLAAPPSLLMTAHSEEFRFLSSQNPFDAFSSQDLLSFVLVSRSWNNLARELLYENIAVPLQAGRCDTLRSALEHGAADLVRSIRLTANRADQNTAILALCPRVQVVCQPDADRMTRLFSQSPAISLPTFEFLKHVYWTESIMTSELLRLLLAAAPNIEHLFLQPPSYLGLPEEDALTLPALPHLRRLEFPGFIEHPGVQLLDLNQLTRLNCASRLEFPPLPALETLNLTGPHQGIDLSLLFARCPRLRELTYDVWSSVIAPSPNHPPHAALDELRLHSSVTADVYNWRPIKEHFNIFVSPMFPHVRRLVLEGAWTEIVHDRRFTPFRDGLYARGCRLEFPEGVVLGRT
ncbi:hypothetical protein FB45DRAFT_1056033 [Roridomyces roridus]|uniref:F-box domain-containing protein n=1 Tax=Roridomyces roridus TaxID=1738132 RepID=A0AAD7FT75_9AGAR|nr:hypothetical protein FB45DRAFT_1056033 [Roridomyces roridus]